MITKFPAKRPSRRKRMQSGVIYKTAVAKYGCGGVPVGVRFVEYGKHGQQFFKLGRGRVVKGERDVFTRGVDFRYVFIVHVPNRWGVGRGCNAVLW